MIKIAKTEKTNVSKKPLIKGGQFKANLKKKSRVKKVRSKKAVSRAWHLIDCSQKPLGRTATEIATLLIGKNKPDFKSYLDQGDYVVAINAAKVFLTGKKMDQKVYFHHTGFPGAIRSRTFRELLNTKPEWIVFEAVKGMLPKNHLGMRMIRRLKIFRDEKHPYIDLSLIHI